MRTHAFPQPPALPGDSSGRGIDAVLTPGRRPGLKAGPGAKVAVLITAVIMNDAVH